MRANRKLEALDKLGTDQQTQISISKVTPAGPCIFHLMCSGHPDSGHHNHRTNGHQHRGEPHLVQRQRGGPGVYSANILAGQMDRD